MTTLGIIGAGNIGSQVARKAIEAGYDVVIGNSRGPETLAALVAELGPNARAATALEVAEAADVAVVTVPLHAYQSIPVDALAGKIVLDTNNYYPQRDGSIAELDDESTTTAELLQAHLPGSRVVKAFNHIAAADITADARPAGSDSRRALVAASDSDEALEFARGLYDQFGFDTVALTPLSEGWRIQRDTPGYGAKASEAELRDLVAAAKRYRETA
ncbi:NADP oxidoreductase [Pseudoclavibacter sp. RFBI5]|uniref:NADPH-dependent F420 reductase n=1 Tax=Pseudoclavibacter sp. RFBI5 TaxID=2080578 RepID=UPI000CE8436C|nr:NAD(P)-binding domain-containing protein [Pseudoclavibacter sp. RFBI5]PPG03228.1 NADP oxidoreductase [Pseudoclavibacter sp. RFBI5]